MTLTTKMNAWKEQEHKRTNAQSASGACKEHIMSGQGHSYCHATNCCCRCFATTIVWMTLTTKMNAWQEQKSKRTQVQGSRRRLQGAYYERARSFLLSRHKLLLQLLCSHRRVDDTHHKNECMARARAQEDPSARQPASLALSILGAGKVILIVTPHIAVAAALQPP